MKGLTSAEEFVLLDCLSPQADSKTDFTPEQRRACRSLLECGRVTFERHPYEPDWITAAITPAGLAALRLHRHLAALGAL